MRHAFAVQEPPDEPDRLFEPIEPRAEAGPEIEPEGVVFALEPAAAQTENEAPIRQVVDRRRELGCEARVAKGVGSHQKAEPDTRCDHGDRRQGRPALELRVGGIALVGEQVIVDP